MVPANVPSPGSLRGRRGSWFSVLLLASVVQVGCFYGNTRPILLPDTSPPGGTAVLKVAHPGKEFRSDSLSARMVLPFLNFAYGYFPARSFGDSTFQVRFGLTSNGVESNLRVMPGTNPSVHLLSALTLQTPIPLQVEEYRTHVGIHNSLWIRYVPQGRILPAVASGVYLEGGWYGYDKGSSWYQRDSSAPRRDLSFPLLTYASVRNLEMGIPLQLSWETPRMTLVLSAFWSAVSFSKADSKTALGLERVDSVETRPILLDRPRQSVRATSPVVQVAIGWRIPRLP